MASQTINCWKAECRLEKRSIGFYVVLALFALLLYLAYQQSFPVIDSLVEVGAYSYEPYSKATFPPVIQLFLEVMVLLFSSVLSLYCYISAHRDVAARTRNIRTMRNSYATVTLCRLGFMAVLALCCLLITVVVSSVLQMIWNHNHREFAYVINGTEWMALARKVLAIVNLWIHDILYGQIVGNLVFNGVVGIGLTAAAGWYGTLWVGELVTWQFRESNMFDTFMITVENASNYTFSQGQALALSVLSVTALLCLALFVDRVHYEK